MRYGRYDKELSWDKPSIFKLLSFLIVLVLVLGSVTTFIYSQSKSLSIESTKSILDDMLFGNEPIPNSNSDDWPTPLDIHTIQVRNPTSLPRINEVVRYTLNLADGELQNKDQFIVNNTNGEVLSGSLASTVIKYPSNFIKKMDIVFQDDFQPDETKSFDIITGQTSSLSSDLSFTTSSPAWVNVFDGTRHYQIQGSHSLTFYGEGVYVYYTNLTNRASATILTRIGGNQLCLDQTIFPLAWGAPNSMTIDSNKVMVSVHMTYNDPIMINWGVGSSQELYKDVDLISADVTINIYNDKPMIETFTKKTIKDKFYNHNGFVMEFSALYDGDGEYITIFGNSDHTIMKEKTKLLTWERVDSNYAGIDVGNYSVPAFTDLDGNGTYDMVLGTENGTLVTYLRSGGWILNTSIFSGIDVGNRSAPTFGDLDNDGDNDTVVGNETGELWYFNNTGTPSNPVWTSEPSMFSGIDVGNYSTPDLADLDGDGDLDLVIGRGIGNLSYYENTGSPSFPIWTKNDTLFELINEGSTRLPSTFVKTDQRYSAPEFADVDSDGDLDFTSGVEISRFGAVVHFENVGNVTTPTLTRLRPDLFGTVRGGSATNSKDHTSPEFVDIDLDSDLDLILGTLDGTLSYFQNNGEQARDVSPVNNMQPLENGSYRFYLDQDSNDGPYATENYSDDFWDYYVLAKPSTSNAMLRYVPDFTDLAFRDRYAGDQYIWAGGNVSYYPFMPDEDGYVTRGLLISRGFSGTGFSKGVSGGSFISQTGTAGGYIKVPMTAMTYDSKEMLLLEIGYTTNMSFYDDTVDILKTPMEIIVLPDLELNSDDIVFSPRVAGEGESVTITVNVKNVGGSTANNVLVEFYRDIVNPANLIDTKSILILNASESKNTSAVWDSLGHPGPSKIIVELDSQGTIVELDESNNIANKSLEVTRWTLGREMFQITSDSNNSMDPTLAIDSSGRIWVAYHTYTAHENFEIFSRNYDGVWSSEELLVANSKHTSRPFLVSMGNEIWLVYSSNIIEYDAYISTQQGWYYWAQKFDMYAKRNDGMSWQPEQRISFALENNKSHQVPSAIIDSTGKLWIAYRHTHFQFYTNGNQMDNIPYQDLNITAQSYDGGWSGEIIVANEPGSEGYWNGPVLGNDKFDNLWVIYEREILNFHWDIYGRYYNGSAWSPLVEITSDIGNDMRPSVTKDKNGNLWVVWETDRHGNKEIYARYFNGTWSQEFRLTNDQGHDIKPYVTSDRFGNVWVVWETDRDGNKDIYLKRFDGSKWSPDIPLTTDEGSDECAFIISDDATGDLWVAWESDRNGHGNQDIYVMKLFIVDLSAPMTTLTIGEPKFISIGTYVTSSTPLSLEADDNEGVGIRSTWFRTWNSTDGWTQWTEYSSQFTLTGDDGLIYIEYNSTDNLGYNEIPNNVTVYLDNTDPGTSLSIGQPSFGTTPIFITSSTDITLIPTDSGSGINSTWFRIWNTTSGWTPWNLYSMPFTILGPDGTRYIEYNSTDNIGHQEVLNNNTIISELYLDDSPPVTTLTLDSPQYDSGGTTYINSSTSITLDPDDISGSGINSTWYTVWDPVSGWSGLTQYNIPFTLSGPDGIRYIEYNSTDNLGHQESPNNYTAISELYLDDSSPTTTLVLGNPQYTIGSTIYFNSSTSVTLTPSDFSGSGISSTWFMVWNPVSGWSGLTQYSIPFTLSGPNGIRYIEYNSTDNLGNAEMLSNHSAIAQLYLDNIAPSTTLTISGTTYISGLDTFVNELTEFNLTTIDDVGASIWFKNDTIGTWLLYDGNFTIGSMPDGSHTIYYNATDYLGQVEATQNMVVILDKTTPTSTINVVYLDVGGNKLIGIGTEFNMSATDNVGGSGVQGIWYKIDPTGIWTQFTGAFNLSGLLDGNHTIFYYSVDNVNNNETIQTFTVYLDVQAPTAKAGEDSEILEGDTHAFDGSQSWDNSEIINAYTWTFIYDGQPVTLYGINPTYKFDIAGNYEVTLTLEDPFGNSAIDTMWVNVTIPPLPGDSDRDGLPDSWEADYFGNLDQIGSNDTDSDGLNNTEEYEAGTDPTKADTDDDGLTDSSEINDHSTDPKDADTDGDGLSDGDEVMSHGTDPKKADTDGDGTNDGDEIAAGTNPLVAEPEELDFLYEYWWLLLIVIVIIIVVLLVLLLMLKRRKPAETEMEEEDYLEEGVEDETQIESEEEMGIGEIEEDFENGASYGDEGGEEWTQESESDGEIEK